LNIEYPISNGNQLSINRHDIKLEALVF